MIAVTVDAPEHAQARARLVLHHLERRGIRDEAVVAAMLEVPRHAFVPQRWQEEAYADRPLPIGHGATISQPYVVGLMLQLAGLRPGARVLDVGTGSGYQAALLAAMGMEVYGVELVEPLVDRARLRLASLQYRARLRLGNGYRGWDEAGPFDAILVAAAPTSVPEALVQQLAPGGRMVVPVGPRFRQELTVVRRQGPTICEERGLPVAFVPMLEREPWQHPPTRPPIGDPEAERA